MFSYFGQARGIRLYLIGFFVLSFHALQAQYAERVRTTRPSVTMGTYTVGKNVLQWQTGLQFRDIEKEAATTSAFQYKTVVRLGILENWELNGVINYEKDEINAGNTHSSKVGISALRLGARYHFFDGKGLLRAGAIQGRLWFQSPSDDFQQAHLGGRLMTSIAYKLVGKLGLVTNVGVFWRGNETPASTFFSLRLTQPLNKKLILVADYFSPFKDFEPDYALGFGYYIHKELKLDIAVGWLGKEGLQDRYVEVGFATRVDWRKEKRGLN